MNFLNVSTYKSSFISGVFSSVLDIIRTIRDPEKPNTLEELEVVTESCVEVHEINEDEYLVIIRFTPTVPHCSLATLIGKTCILFRPPLLFFVNSIAFVFTKGLSPI